MTRIYTDLEPTDPDWTRWTGAQVLRRQAAERGDRTFLIAPEEDVEITFAELLESAERVAGGLRAAGAITGDRVIIMARNSSRFVLTWFGTAVGDLVEVPVNTAYEGEFLRHQVQLVDARWAVVDDDLADRFIALKDRLDKLEKFWVIDSAGDAEGAVARLRAAGWDAEPWDALRDAERYSEAAAGRPRTDGRVLHVGNHGAVQGRVDAQRPHELLRRDHALPDPVHRERHLAVGHAPVPRQRAVHGRLPGPHRRRACRASARASAPAAGSTNCASTM